MSVALGVVVWAGLGVIRPPTPEATVVTRPGTIAVGAGDPNDRELGCWEAVYCSGHPSQRSRRGRHGDEDDRPGNTDHALGHDNRNASGNCISDEIMTVPCVATMIDGHEDGARAGVTRVGHDAVYVDRSSTQAACGMRIRKCGEKACEFHPSTQRCTSIRDWSWIANVSRVRQQRAPCVLREVSGER